MLKIVVCDDDSAQLDQMKTLLAQYDTSVSRIDVSFFSHPNQIMDEPKNIEITQVFLLDIVMPELTGIELAKQIRSLNKEAIIIFLTSSKDYALEAYGLKAMDYLLKPVAKLELFDALKQACLLCEKKVQLYSIQTRKDIVSVKISDIKYIEYRDHVIYFTVEDRVIKSKFYRTSFEEAIQPLFENNAFVLSHRSYLINMNHVQRMNHDGFIMDDQTFIPIAKNRIIQVRKIYLNYCLRG